MDWASYGQAFGTLIVIMDPLGGVPIFLSLTRDMTESQRARAAYTATFAAAMIVLVAAFAGELLLRLLSISVESLMAAGGVLLFIVALEMLRGGTQSIATVEEDVNLALVPLGTPLLAGPGTIAAVIVLMRQSGETGEKIATLLGFVCVLLTVLLALRFAGFAGRYLRPSAIHFITRIMGLLLTAIAVQLVVRALGRWVESGFSL